MISDLPILAGAATAAVFIAGCVYVKLGSRPKPTPLGLVDLKRNADINAINNGICPDCGANGTLLCGPSGGMSQNLACNSCLMEFNVHFGFGIGSIGVDRSGKLTDSRARLFGINANEYRIIEGTLNHG
jgi:hypothetical protein